MSNEKMFYHNAWLKPRCSEAVRKAFFKEHMLHVHDIEICNEDFLYDMIGNEYLYRGIYHLRCPPQRVVPPQRSTDIMPDILYCMFFLSSDQSIPLLNLFPLAWSTWWLFALGFVYIINIGDLLTFEKILCSPLIGAITCHRVCTVLEGREGLVFLIVDSRMLQ